MEQQQGTDLDAFLADHSSVGIHDSEGHFTLMVEEAQRKIVEYQFERKEAWVRLLVQAASLWGCWSVRVSCRAKDTQFRFYQASVNLPTTYDILESLRNPQEIAETAVDKFARALLALTSQLKASFVLWTPKPNQGVIYEGDYFRHLTAAERGKTRYREDDCLTLTVGHSDDNWASIQLREVQIGVTRELYESCTLCPSDIYLDGESVNGRLLDHRKRTGETLIPMCAFAVESDEEDVPKLRWPLSLSKVFSYDPTGPRESFALSVLTLVNSDFRVGYEPAATRRSRIWWLRQGVLVDSTVLPVSTRCLELSVYVNADDLKVDFTGFQVRNDAVKVAREKMALEALREAWAAEVDPRLDKTKLDGESNVVRLGFERGLIPKTKKLGAYSVAMLPLLLMVPLFKPIWAAKIGAGAVSAGLSGLGLNNLERKYLEEPKQRLSEYEALFKEDLKSIEAFFKDF